MFKTWFLTEYFLHPHTGIGSIYVNSFYVFSFFNSNIFQERQKFCQRDTSLHFAVTKSTVSNFMLNVFFWHWETEKCQDNNKKFIFNDSDWLFMSICATRAHLWPQNLTEMIQICLIFDVKLPKHLTTSKELSLIEPIPGTHWAQLNSLGNQFLCWQRSRSGKTIGAMDW